MTADPCFSCRLPDCDDTHPRCAVRQLSNLYLNKRRRGVPHLVTAEELKASNEARAFRLMESKAAASEGRAR